MRDWIVKIFTERNVEPDSRTHPQLTEISRKRIANITEQYVRRRHIDDAYSEFLVKKGDGVSYFTARNRSPAYESNNRFIVQEDHLEVIEYLEILINVVWSDENMNQEELVVMNRKINDALVSEAVLWKLVPAEDEVLEGLGTGHKPSYGGPAYDPKIDGQFRFDQLADETVEEVDHSLQVLMQGKDWEEPLKPYNEAWDIYQQGPPHSATIAEKLYNALEDVLQKICVDQGWENSQQTVKTYFDRVGDEGLLDTNRSMIGEWEQILSGIRVGVQKTGSRKNWHQNIEEDYCLLLIHQTAAFLTFIIR